MKSKLQILILIIISLLLMQKLYSYNYFSPVNKIKTLFVDVDNLEFELGEGLIIINTERVYNDSIVFVSDLDYKLYGENNVLKFLRPLGYVTIEYQIYPEELIKRYSTFQIIEYSDSIRIETIHQSRDAPFTDSQLTISGNKTISISVSNEKDFELDQSLYLRIYGKLSDNLNVEAQLTDSESPITPEGDSREISTLDQVFFRLFGKQYEIAFGDLELEMSRTNFTNFTPKFEGLKAGWFGQNGIYGALAVSKGKRIRIEFYGVNGKQGPYYLSVNGSRGVLVVPGSEKVYLNGLLISRGDDYTIDYSEGSITFTESNFIDSEAKIAVSFQYSDENYRQNMYLVNSEVNLLERLKITSQMIIQNDDRDNPLSVQMNDENIAVLQEAGDGEAWGSGILEVEDGVYILTEEGYFVYVGNDSLQQGNYELYFTRVGSEAGLYEYDSEGDFYYYVGTGGLYLPIRRLPAPVRQDNYNMRVSHWGDGYNLVLEGFLTNYDKNTFSNKDDDDNMGRAFYLEAGYFPDLDNLQPELKFYYRNLTSRLKSFSDLNDAYEAYEMAPLPDSLQKTELGGEASFRIYDYVEPVFVLRQKKSDDYAVQNYFSSLTEFKQKFIMPEMSYRYLKWDQEFAAKIYPDTRRLELSKSDLKLKYSLAGYYFGGNVLEQVRQDYFAASNPEKEKITEYKGYAGIINHKILTAEISYESENIDSLHSEEDWSRVRKSRGLNWRSNFRIGDQMGQLDYTRKQIETAEKQNFDMASIRFDNSIWKNMLQVNSLYSIQNLEFYPKIRELQYVGSELGIYDSLGFVAEEGEYDYVITSIDYDNPQMSVEVNASANIYCDPGRVTDSFLKRINLETFLFISENSKADAKQKVYCFDPDYVRNEEFTLYGRRIVDQVIWLDIVNRKITLKLDYRNSETVDQRYNDRLESEKVERQGIMLRFLQIMNSNSEISYKKEKQNESRFEVEIKKDVVNLEIQNQLGSDATLNSSISYEYEKGSERGIINTYEIKSWMLEEKIIWNVVRKYRFYSRISFRNNQREGFASTSYIDKLSGDIFKWNLGLNYRVNNYTYFNVEYSGNSYPLRDTVHKLRMEINAEF
ncbi:MAG: hypothetical protein APR54_00365 [Candidatus Cloacimonas sp. SDB]|nr:MAG: hypothetical protein APR54_00365 [Candidatus Cloacimonas sp. SDB]